MAHLNPNAAQSPQSAHNPPFTTSGLPAQNAADILPAPHRTEKYDIIKPAMDIDFLKGEFSVSRLNKIHDWLWLVGRPTPPRPLHVQMSRKREIVVHEQADLHLVWRDQRMFLKPIPRYLFDLVFWRNNLSCESCESCKHRNGQCPASAWWKCEREACNHKKWKCSSSACLKCEVYTCALGFLLSYTSLISYEIDLRIAKEAGLVPEELTWGDWRRMAEELLTRENLFNINKRYVYGELRLTRLNKVYRYTFRSPIRGYLYGYTSYQQFWHDNLTHIASVFVYIIVVLTAMQVGLITDRLKNNGDFQAASYGFTVFSILAPLAFVGLVFGAFFVIFLSNWIATEKYEKKVFAAIESLRAGNGA